MKLKINDALIIAVMALLIGFCVGAGSYAGSAATQTIILAVWPA